jgi:hypothetical protein
LAEEKEKEEMSNDLSRLYKKLGVLMGFLCLSHAMMANNQPLHPQNDQSPLIFDKSKISVSSHIRGQRINYPQSNGSWDIQTTSNQVFKVKLHAQGPEGLDLRSKIWLCLDIVNKGHESLLIKGRAYESWKETTGGTVVEAGKKATLYIHLPRAVNDEVKHSSLYGNIKGFPNGTYASSWKQLNLAEVRTLDLDIYSASGQINIALSKLRGMADFVGIKDYKFSPHKRPYVDGFGQNILEDWTGKVKHAHELKMHLKQELDEMKANPRGINLSVFGGDLLGPQNKATGHFYTKKIADKWWFIDPQGYLFWSFGLTSIGYGGDTSEPALDQLKATYVDSGELIKGKRPGTWNPSQSNLQKKYGENWREIYPKMTNRRLRSWGFNTLGNWTKKEFYELKKMPYTQAVHFGRPEIKEGKQLKSLPDAFHPSFEKGLSQALLRYQNQANDPWCIGFFIDNELDFGQQSVQTAEIIFEGREESHSRRMALQHLKNKYSNIADLNEAWRKNYQSWDAISGNLPKNQKNCKKDLLEISALYLDRYFSVCSEMMKKHAPHKLYLGSRIHFKENNYALIASSRYCDVVSVNYYDFSPLTIQFPKEINKPMIIGEYHFGTINESGVWGGGLCTSVDIEHAAAQFKAYTEHAFRDPRYVGAHYFQLQDQVVTGRPDGENYRIGFVDITDQPYEAMRRRAREIGNSMYSKRLGKISSKKHLAKSAK